jgi:hypothetical protein
VGKRLRKSSLDNDQPSIVCIKQAFHTWAIRNLSTPVIRMTATIKTYLNRSKEGELSLLDKENGFRTKFTQGRWIFKTVGVPGRICEQYVVEKKDV